ncbi:MAG TPA: hypothetical protein V6D17_17325 [Candidatus Obscuribacterales bacterium]
MDTFKPLGNYQAISRYVSEALWRPTNLPEPFRSASDLRVFRAAVADGRDFLPSRYYAPYLDVLEAALNQAQASILALSPKAKARRASIIAQLESVFEVLAAPIVQLSSTQLQNELKAFMALTSNLYRRFVDDEKVKQAQTLKLLWPELDPLGYFGSNATGPYTLVASKELPVTLIAKPAQQMNCVALWLADGHEVGGHCVQTSISGFHADMKSCVEAAIKKAYAEGTIKTSKATFKLSSVGSMVFDGRRSVNVEQFLVELFSAWTAEIAADAAGLINLGPLFVNSGMLLLGNSRAGGGLSTTSEFDSRTGFAEHPIDLVRVLLAIEMVKRLAFKNGLLYAKSLNERLAKVCGGRIPQAVSWYRRSGAKVADMQLADITAALPHVANALLHSRLPALGNQSLSQLMSWTDNDEKLVRQVADQLTTGDTSIDSEVEARHVAAASLLALEQASNRSNFEQQAPVINSSAVTALASIYDEQCLLCALPAVKSKKGPASTTQLIDLVRLVKEMKGR